MQQHLLACIPRQNRTAGERHKNRARGSDKGTNFKASFGHNIRGNRTIEIHTVRTIYTASSRHDFRGKLYNI